MPDPSLRKTQMKKKTLRAGVPGRKSTRSPTAATMVKVRLIKAIQEFAEAQGEAQWTNGYRCGRPEREAELVAKEFAQWGRCCKLEAVMLSRLDAYARAIAKNGKS
jgi:hypothetical protein